MRMRTLGPLLLTTLLVNVAAAESGDSVPAKWQVQRIEFPYIGFTTAYACNALEQKLRDILVAVGAHPNTQVNASGCVLDRPSRTVLIDVVTAVPKTVTDSTQSDQPEDRAELLRRLGITDNLDAVQFPATWQTIRLGEQRDLDLEPGDCELMAELRDEVFPKLGMKIVAENVNCSPNQLDIRTPRLQVAALVPAG